LPISSSVVSLPDTAAKTPFCYQSTASADTTTDSLASTDKSLLPSFTHNPHNEKGIKNKPIKTPVTEPDNRESPTVAGDLCELVAHDAS
jgi:hypothetical protein